MGASMYHERRPHTPSSTLECCVVLCCTPVQRVVCNFAPIMLLSEQLSSITAHTVVSRQACLSDGQRLHGCYPIDNLHKTNHVLWC